MSFCISSLLALFCLVSVLLILVLISERGIDLHRPAPGRRVWWCDGLSHLAPCLYSTKTVVWSHGSWRSWWCLGFSEVCSEHLSGFLGQDEVVLLDAVSSPSEHSFSQFCRVLDHRPATYHTFLLSFLFPLPPHSLMQLSSAASDCLLFCFAEVMAKSFFCRKKKRKTCKGKGCKENFCDAWQFLHV